ncbi:hypothetical protein PanWU01x14_247150 [Parasponia andersonii]|uniref:DUF3511 domain protein n=1 Tax=Parasponia andersonii TaxID=3476 RepID=A0A2P5BE99_PARAD|nr:hypothetical protein PanWU01x14_247150 [Parasponia andersonii]
MENYRSRSCREGGGGGGGMQMEVYYRNRGEDPPPTSMRDLRCYSANHAWSSGPAPANEAKIRKAKSGVGSTSKSWSFNDPELQRKKRVAGYKAYAVEGKMKGSLRKSFRWIKNTYTQVIYGWR